MKIKNGTTDQIDPRIDEYITSLFNFAEKYNLNNQSKKVLNNVIYLLLNKDFQYTIRSLRLVLYMPIDGFKNQKEWGLWTFKFEEIIERYHKGEQINKETSDWLKIVEKDIDSPLVNGKYWSKKSKLSIWEIVVVQTCYRFGKYFGLKDTKNSGYLMAIFVEILYFYSPRKIIKHLYDWSKVFGADSIYWEQEGNTMKMIITLYPDTTFKDIERLVESSRSKTTELLNKIKGNARKNTSKTDDIKRDYFIYKTYISHKINRKRGGDDIYFNVGKPDAVIKSANISLDKHAQSAKYLEVESIRKIVNRMNKRIKNAFTDTELNKYSPHASILKNRT